MYSCFENKIIVCVFSAFAITLLPCSSFLFNYYFPCFSVAFFISLISTILLYIFLNCVCLAFYMKFVNHFYLFINFIVNLLCFIWTVLHNQERNHKKHKCQNKEVIYKRREITYIQLPIDVVEKDTTLFTHKLNSQYIHILKQFKILQL